MRDFFKQDGSPRDIDQTMFFKITSEPEDHITDVLYRPDELVSKFPRGLYRVENKTFVNVSFSKTTIKHLEFINCRFLRCLFIGTTFKSCRFSGCSFIDTNVHRVEFIDVYIDPRSFSKCLDIKRHQNIGVHLHHDVLKNSRQQAQPEFSDISVYQFRKWKRAQAIYEMSKLDCISKVKKLPSILSDIAYQHLLGYGVRWMNLFITTLLSCIVLSIINFKLSNVFGLHHNGAPLTSFIDVFYFTTVILTTLGFGDIAPVTQIGRLVIAIEALLGFLLLALLASMTFRKITQ